MLAVGAVLLVGATGCGDDDEGGTFGDLGGGGGGGAGGGGVVTEPSGGGGGSSRDTFVASCGTFPGTSQEMCECAFDEISATVPESEYAAFEAAFLADPTTPLPDWLTDAVAGCA